MKQRPVRSSHDALRRECERELLLAKLAPVDRFYGFRELMRAKSVSQTTLERALRPLIQDAKILEARDRSGLYVTERIEVWRKQRRDSRVKWLGLVLPYWAGNA